MKFDCIIVGAGPAGVTAAFKLARAGLNVVIFERGVPGSKNMFGGVLYSTVLNKLIPEFWKEAPVERHVVRKRFSLLSRASEAAADLRFSSFNGPPYNNSFTVLRARFDRWYAKKAEEAGALLITDAVVEDFITENGVIKGVKVAMEGGDVMGDCVICAEGANTLLAEKAGLRKKPSPSTMTLGVKEVISLPKEVIEDRFSLEDGEGASFEFFGTALGGAVGSGFIYTNKDTLSVGVGAPVSVLKDTALKPNELIEGFKSHPCVRNYLRGGKIEEFSAHMIPEGGYRALPALVTDGLMLAGDSAGFVNPSLFREGTNLAMASGVFAAETVIEAREKGDFSKAALNSYVRKLEKSFVIKDLKRYKDAPQAIGSIPGLFREDPEAILDFLQGHFTVSDKSKDEVHAEIKKAFRNKVSMRKLALEIYRAAKLLK